MEPDSVTGQPILRKELASVSLRDELSRHCGRKFHQTCEHRRPIASKDLKYYDKQTLPSGEVVFTTRDLTHRLCSPCIVEVYGPQEVTVKYSGSLPGRDF